VLGHHTGKQKARQAAARDPGPRATNGRLASDLISDLTPPPLMRCGAGGCCPTAARGKGGSEEGNPAFGNEKDVQVQCTHTNPGPNPSAIPGHACKPHLGRLAVDART
jgi:hypothetical protein